MNECTKKKIQLNRYSFQIMESWWVPHVENVLFMDMASKILYALSRVFDIKLLHKIYSRKTKRSERKKKHTHTVNIKLKYVFIHTHMEVGRKHGIRKMPFLSNRFAMNFYGILFHLICTFIDVNCYMVAIN